MNEKNAYNLQEALGPNMTAEVRTEEHPDDRLARLAREARDHVFGLWLRGAIFILLVLALLYCGYLLQQPALDPNVRELALTVVSSIVTGFLGYFVGRRS